MILGEGARDRSPCPLSQTLSPNPKLVAQAFQPVLKGGQCPPYLIE